MYIALPPLALAAFVLQEPTTALLLVSAIWLRDRFDDGAATALYLALFSAVLLTLVVATIVEERRVREPEPVKQVLRRERAAPGAGP